MAYAPAPTGLVKAFFPLWATVLVLVVTRIPDLGLKGMLNATEPAARFSLGGLGDLSISAALVAKLSGIFGTTAEWAFSTLYIPAFIPFFLVSGASLLLFRADAATTRAVFAETYDRMKKPIIALLGALVMVNLMRAGGDEAMVIVIGQAFADAFGMAWQYVAAYLGAIGAFFSGSNTVSNLMFAGIQQSIAQSLGLDPTRHPGVAVGGRGHGQHGLHQQHRRRLLDPRDPQHGGLHHQAHGRADDGLWRHRRGGRLLPHLRARAASGAAGRGAGLRHPAIGPYGRGDPPESDASAMTDWTDFADALDLGPLIPEAFARYRRAIIDGMMAFLDRLPDEQTTAILLDQAMLRRGRRRSPPGWSPSPGTARRCTSWRRCWPATGGCRPTCGRICRRWRRCRRARSSTGSRARSRPRSARSQALGIRLDEEPLAEASVAIVVPFVWTDGARRASAAASSSC